MPDGRRSSPLLTTRTRRAHSAALEEQDGLRPKVKVDEMFGRVDHVRAEIRADDAVPCWPAGGAQGGNLAVSREDGVWRVHSSGGVFVAAGELLSGGI
jgi:hypothetical protein